MPKNILIIDDHEVVLGALLDYLQELNPDYNLLPALGGQEALAILEDRVDEIDLVITDIDMPKVDGFMIIDYVKENKPSLPIIVMTGKGSQTTIDKVKSTLANTEGVSIQAVQFVSKPMSFRDFSVRVNDLLHTKLSPSKAS